MTNSASHTPYRWIEGVKRLKGRQGGRGRNEEG